MNRYHSASIYFEKLKGVAWKNFIDMMFDISDYFTLRDLKLWNNSILSLSKYEMQLNCDELTFENINYLRKNKSCYKMYKCEDKLKKFFLKYKSYIEFEEDYEDLVFLKNRRSIYLSISHEGYYDIEVAKTNINLYDKAKQYNMLEYLYNFE